MKRTPLKRKAPMKRGNPATLERDKRSWKRSARLAKVSPERKELLTAYFRASEQARANDTTCQRCRKSCMALDIHHPYGRRSYQNLMRFILLCRACHTWVHDHANEAFLQGWLQPEYKGYPRHPEITFPEPWERAYGPENKPAWVMVPRQVRTPQTATLKANHHSIDWSQPVKVTAALLDLSPTTVTSYMHRNGIPLPSRQKKHNHAQPPCP
jgi:hypothetical protein